MAARKKESVTVKFSDAVTDVMAGKHLPGRYTIRDGEIKFRGRSSKKALKSWQDESAIPDGEAVVILRSSDMEWIIGQLGLLQGLGA